MGPRRTVDVGKPRPAGERQPTACSSSSNRLVLVHSPFVTLAKQQDRTTVKPTLPDSWHVPLWSRVGARSREQTRSRARLLSLDCILRCPWWGTDINYQWQCEIRVTSFRPLMLVCFRESYVHVGVEPKIKPHTLGVCLSAKEALQRPSPPIISGAHHLRPPDRLIPLIPTITRSKGSVAIQRTTRAEPELRRAPRPGLEAPEACAPPFFHSCQRRFLEPPPLGLACACSWLAGEAERCLLKEVWVPVPPCVPAEHMCSLSAHAHSHRTS